MEKGLKPMTTLDEKLKSLIGITIALRYHNYSRSILLVR